MVFNIQQTKFTDLPKELILHILEFTVDKIDFICDLFNINKEIRELMKENPIWIHISHILESEKCITPIQSIIKNNFCSPDGQIFSKLQEYFQSLSYIQYIQLKKHDNDQETIIFDPFSKLCLNNSNSFSELIQIFGINVFRAFHSYPNDLSSNIGIMDTMMYDLDVNRGENIIQASFLVGEDTPINTFLIQFNDNKNEVKEPPMLTCPQLNITITTRDVQENNLPFNLLDKMKCILSSKYQSTVDFICWEKIKVRKSKIFKISKKEETTHSKIKQIMKQKRFEYWFGNDNVTGNIDSFFKFAKIPSQQV